MGLLRYHRWLHRETLRTHHPLSGRNITGRKKKKKKRFPLEIVCASQILGLIRDRSECVDDHDGACFRTHADFESRQAHIHEFGAQGYYQSGIPHILFQCEGLIK